MIRHNPNATRAALFIRAPTEPRTESSEDITDTDITELCTNDLKACEMRLLGKIFDEIKIKGIIPNDDAQEMLYKFLKPSGKLLIEGIKDREEGQALALDLQIHGFFDTLAAKEPGTSNRFVVCKKPAKESTDAVPLKAGSSTETKSPAVETEVKNAGKKWIMDSSELADEDLIDENDLLDKDDADIPEESKKEAAVGKGDGGCGVVEGGKRRACKDCTCGLADVDAATAQELNKNASVEDKIVRASACGNCSKGDAFRCASCPFLGKPAFETGNERVVLAMGNDDF